jgi:hypothetical protein
MLEFDTHQASGLAALARPMTPRVVTLVSHGDRRSELPLLWSLCSSWTALDFPVVVLDGQTQETELQPGLLQLLSEGQSSGFGDAQETPSDWPILASSLGLERLLQHNGAAHRQADAWAEELAQVFHSYELIVLYAPASIIAGALHNSDVSPLVSVSSESGALLTAYQAIKQLASLGDIQPTVISMMQQTSDVERIRAAQVARTLQGCVRDFLGNNLVAISVDPLRQGDIEGLALRAMENAYRPLGPNPFSAVESLRASKGL